MSDDILNIIHTKIDKIAEDITEIKVGSARQVEIANQHEKTLQTHVKRSDQLENLYHYLDETKIQPLQSDMAQIKGIYKFLGILGVIASIIMVIMKLTGK